MRQTDRPDSGFDSPQLLLMALFIFGLMVVAVILVSEVIMATLGEDSYDFYMEGTYQLTIGMGEGLDYASWVVVFTGYFSIPVVIWATTIGKRVFGLYVVRADGSKVGFGRALQDGSATSSHYLYSALAS